MAVAVSVSGLLGSVTFANGYTTQVSKWHMDFAPAMQRLTALSPTGNHEVLATTNLLNGATGWYEAEFQVVPTTTVTGPTYISYPEYWRYRQMCAALETTALTATWRTYIGGLVTTEGEIGIYLNDTTALPLVETGTAVFILATGQQVSLPYISDGIGVGVSIDDDERRIVLRVKGSGAPTITGIPPLAATAGVVTAGAATLQATTSRTYAGNIQVTSVDVSANNRTSEGRIRIEFVSNGAIVGA